MWSHSCAHTHTHIHNYLLQTSSRSHGSDGKCHHFKNMGVNYAPVTRLFWSQLFGAVCWRTSWQARCAAEELLRSSSRSFEAARAAEVYRGNAAFNPEVLCRKCKRSGPKKRARTSQAGGCKFCRRSNWNIPFLFDDPHCKYASLVSPSTDVWFWHYYAVGHHDLIWAESGLTLILKKTFFFQLSIWTAIWAAGKSQFKCFQFMH